ncbi:hypothetical protein BDQ12DRAFT_683485 [Crucibulum laeve]|uniref:Uncharacterized protein n=1 Tax=Crucibulum laeve TaxID=68775 RepID=A0A5C3M0V9_9AGAR|nr:hypothetical protein BDQ12DRAFT_683485 [Crucibulum laeve]
MRPPSPTGTELADPDIDHLNKHLASKGIKVIDYAYQPRLRPLPNEIFDQRRGIAEYEWHIAHNPRKRAVPGKTLRRLLDLKWITPEEMNARCAPHDFANLQEHDSRPHHPWVPAYADVTPPDACARALHLAIWTPLIASRDRFQTDAENALRVFERQRAEEQEIILRMLGQRASDEEMVAALKGKRSHDRVEAGSQEKAERSGAKRARLSPSSQPEYTGYPLVHPKQYPAPASDYDPVLYPEAASAIESQSQGRPQSQGRSSPHRSDTPPLGGTDTPPLRDSPPPPELRRGLKRTLSRTQTFTQL